MKHSRKHWTSKVYKQIKVGDDTVFIVVVDDLETEQLVWHYKRAIEEEEYEYAAYCHAEATIRGLLITDF